MLFALANGVISFDRALYIFSFISMQLVEYFAWKNLDNKQVIRLLSQIGTLVVISQVVFAINEDKKLPNKTLLYILFACITLVAFMTSKIDYSMHKAPNGHLAWNWLSSFPTWYIVFWIMFILGTTKHYHTMLFYVITISISYYTYSSSGTWGSMWCWIANILTFWWVAKVFYKDLCY
jgi:hypothetical protein